MKGFVVSVLVISAIAAVVFYLRWRNEVDADHILVKFDRGSSVSCAVCGADVFVNGAKVGTVGNGEMKKFTVPATPDGTYDIGARLIPLIGPNFDTDEKKIAAGGGSTLYARFEVNPWVWKLRASTKLEVAIEKAGAPAAPLLAASLRESGTRLAAKAPGQWSSLPWDAIGAIAGVVGGIAAIAALFRRNSD